MDMNGKRRMTDCSYITQGSRERHSARYVQSVASLADLICEGHNIGDETLPRLFSERPIEQSRFRFAYTTAS